jgi:flagellar motor switch protein FliG
MPAIKENTTLAELTGRQKAAILMVALGPDSSIEVFRNLTDEEIEQITMEIASLGDIDSDLVNSVIEEFYETSMANIYIKKGGVDYARTLLETALGEERAGNIISRLQGSLQVTPFDFLKKIDANYLTNFIANEHPQTIALVLAHISYEQASEVLASLPGELQADVTSRIATMSQTTPEIIAEVEKFLERKIASVLSQEFSVAGGIESVAELLNRVDRSTEKNILEILEQDNPDLADEVKKLMFVFEDIILLDNRSIQQVLKEMDNKELALALKGASEEVKAKIFSNMSDRAAEMIKEDMEFMGAVRLKSVEEAQTKIVSIIRRLEESGEIIISRGGEEEMLV